VLKSLRTARPSADRPSDDNNAVASHWQISQKK
jgi:hypothetical protein